MTRLRSRVALDRWDTRCVVFSADGAVADRLYASELNHARRATAVDCVVSPPTPRGQTAMRVLQALDGHCCYALYRHEAGQVKIGRSAAVYRRWAALEGECNCPLQLIGVWRTGDARALEIALHERFASARRAGEWFDAKPVISYLTAALASRLGEAS